MSTQQRYDDIKLDKKTELLIFGYIRRIQQILTTNIALELYRICCLFYFVDAFKIAYDIEDKWDTWDPNALGKMSSVDAGNQYKLIGDHIFHGGYYSFGQEVVSSGIAIWRLKAIQPRLYAFGIVDSRKIALKNKMYNIHKLIKDMYVAHWYGWKWHHGDSEKHEKDWEEDQNQSDILCIVFDHGKRKLSYSVNNKPFKCLFDNVNNDVHYKLTVCASGDVEILASTSY